MDGGASQIVKWGTIRRNERNFIPQIYHDPKYTYALAFDPARTFDNSILGVMRLYQDPNFGWCGDIVNCVNMVDVASKKRYKLDSSRQIEELHEAILNYNGQNPDYEYIDTISIDQGAGGGGVSAYADNLLANWNDKSGFEHRGLIDSSHEIYQSYAARYPDAVDKLRLVNPRKLRTQMVEEFINLMELGVIRFPLEWNGNDFVQRVDGIDKDTGQEMLKPYELTLEEQVSWSNIDIMKTEIASIHKTTNPENTTVTYALSKDKENKMHDDRFYVAILLAHRLFELRRKSTVRQRGEEIGNEPPITVTNIDF